MSKLFAFLLLYVVNGLTNPTVNKCILFSLSLFFSSLLSFSLRFTDVPRHFRHATHHDCFNGLVKPPTIGFTIRPHAFRLPASFVQLIPVTENLYSRVPAAGRDLIRY